MFGEDLQKGFNHHIKLMFVYSDSISKLAKYEVGGTLIVFKIFIPESPARDVDNEQGSGEPCSRC